MRDSFELIDAIMVGLAIPVVIIVILIGLSITGVLPYESDTATQPRPTKEVNK